MTTSSIAFGSGIGHVRGNHTDVPTILHSFGVGTFNAQMVAQYAFMIPRTTDPDAQGVIMMVEAVQRGLQRIGARVNATGILDQATVDALSRVSGPSWHGKTWLQLLGDISDAIGRRVWIGSRTTPLSEYVGVGDIPSVTTIALVAVGGFLLYKACAKKRWENLMYYELGMSDADFCSTSNPQGSCSPISGICKPMNKAALDAIYAFQRELNRLAVKYGFTKTTVDGRIGPLTLALYNKIAAKHPPLAIQASCDQLARGTEALTTTVRGIANGVGAPSAASVSAPVLSRPSTVASDGSIKDPPALAITDTVFNLVSSPFGFIIAAGAAVLAYKMATSGKKAPAKRAAGKRRRRTSKVYLLTAARARRARRAPRRRVRRARRARRR